MKSRLIPVLVICLLITSPLSADLTSGLVAQYLFDGNANDSSGNGHNSTVNGATLAADRFGNPNSAYNFDGADDYIRIAYSSDFQLPTYTVSAWIRPSIDLSSSISAMVTRGSDPTSNHVALFFGTAPAGVLDASGTFMFYEDNSNNGTYYNTDNVPQTGEWTHLAATRTAGNEFDIYLNGSLIGHWNSTPQPTISCLQDLIIGAYSYYPVPDTEFLAHFFPGSIDDVTIYDRALSPSEIRELGGLPVIPAPGAFLAGLTGTGCVNWLRRRRML